MSETKIRAGMVIMRFTSFKASRSIFFHLPKINPIPIRAKTGKTMVNTFCKSINIAVDISELMAEYQERKRGEATFHCFWFYALLRESFIPLFIKREFVTTETELKAMAAPAIMGFKSHPVKG